MGFYRPDILPSTQPTVSEHFKTTQNIDPNSENHTMAASFLRRLTDVPPFTLFVLLYFCCGQSTGQNLLVNQPCCHSEHFMPLYRIVFVLPLMLFVILNVVIFSLQVPR